MSFLLCRLKCDFLHCHPHIETFGERSISAKYKEGDNIALTLHFVQPQEYTEVLRIKKLSLTKTR